MLLGHNVPADREAEPGAFAGWFGGKERLEQFVPDLGRDAGAVVTHPDFDRFAKVAGSHSEHCGLAASPGPVFHRRRVKAVAQKVQKNPRHLLRHQLNRRQRAVEIPLQRYVKLVVPGAGPVIGEIERFVDQSVQINALALAAAAARMRQHAGDDAVGAPAVLGNLVEIAAQGLNELVDLDARTSEPDIFAIGDCTKRPLPLYDRTMRLESVPNALEQAKQAASAIYGRPRPAPEVPWFWSDQYEFKLQIAGLFDGYDDVVEVGDAASGRFSVEYRRNGQLIAVDAVNDGRAHMLARRRIAEETNVVAELGTA